VCCGKCGWYCPVGERRVDELSCIYSYVVGINEFYVRRFNKAVLSWE
jgi:hypothetical protein